MTVDLSPDLITVARAAEELGLSRITIRSAILRGQIKAVPLDARTNLVPRAEVERYRREHLGRHGKPKKQPATPAE
jgi:excisionase family DNA binding protein